MARTAHTPNVAAGVAAGLVGGLVASWTMNRFQALWSKAAAGFESTSAGGSEDARDWQERSEDANATELVAQAIATRTLGRALTRDEMTIAAPVVHYGFGATMGAIYGGVAELVPEWRAWGGAAYGTAIWIAGDEIAVPLFGLSKSTTSYPVEVHAQALGAHLVYGWTTELVRRILRFQISE